MRVARCEVGSGGGSGLVIAPSIRVLRGRPSEQNQCSDYRDSSTAETCLQLISAMRVHRTGEQTVAETRRSARVSPNAPESGAGGVNEWQYQSPSGD